MWIQDGAAHWPERLAVVDTGRGPAGRFTYRDLDVRAERLAAWLHDVAGVRRGDRVGVLALNSVEVLDALFACVRLGAVFVPFNWRSPWRELADLIALTTPTALLYAPAFAPVAADLQRAATPIAHWFVFDDATLPAPGAPRRWAGPASEEDPACLLFTSGTTGLARAAMLSYRMISWNALNGAIRELRRNDVALTATPLFHTAGLLLYTLPLLIMGGTVVLVPKWAPEAVLDLLPREKVTLLFAVPTQFQQLLTAPNIKTADLRGVRLTSGGAPLPVSVIEEFGAVHGVPLRQGFGMTEYGPFVFITEAADAVAKAGSIGTPNACVEAAILDDTGRPVPADGVGELALRGRVLCSGYFNTETAGQAPLEADGWFHTGDLARVDADGFFWIVDRKKDMYLSGGESVYPAEVERVLQAHPAMHQCAVIGVPEPTWGEVGHAFVVLKPGAEATSAELIAFCRERLAAYKAPRHVSLVEALPLSAAGKILKRELRVSYTIT
ncbi:MAG: AMP-binding protein [Anaerolineales bacterium]|nr:AMP-binding protein [Anaerolineales bacterium]